MNNQMLSSCPKRQLGFLSLPNDNVIKTIAVATLLCLVCSVVVALTATLLKPLQIENKLLDKKANILAVAGLTDESVSVDERFAQIESIVVDLETGEVQPGMDGNSYDQRKASKEAEASTVLNKSQDIAGVKRRADLANVYLLKDGGELKKIILPIKGYGLWSTMYGFLALESDASTVSGITFYEHGETPGLGGEIDNKKWQNSWTGKQVFDEAGDVALQVIKGSVSNATPNPEYKIDGLAGATLTSNGVSNTIQFWLGDDAFGPYLNTLRQQQAATNDPESLSSQGSIELDRKDPSNEQSNAIAPLAMTMQERG